FEAYTYPWIAPEPDEPPAWKSIAADPLALGPGEEREFRMKKAAVVQADKEPVDIYFSAVIGDSTHQERIYDLAFALPAFTVPPGKPLPKQYPFLYLYNHLADVPNSEAYRHFYPPQFVSSDIVFDTRHTMFTTESTPSVSYTVKGDGPVAWRLLDSKGTELKAGTGLHPALDRMPPGLYTLEVSSHG